MNSISKFHAGEIFDGHITDDGRLVIDRIVHPDGRVEGSLPTPTEPWGKVGIEDSPSDGDLGPGIVVTPR